MTSGEKIFFCSNAKIFNVTSLLLRNVLELRLQARRCPENQSKKELRINRGYHFVHHLWHSHSSLSLNFINISYSLQYISSTFIFFLKPNLRLFLDLHLLFSLLKFLLHLSEILLNNILNIFEDRQTVKHNLQLKITFKNIIKRHSFLYVWHHVEKNRIHLLELSHFRRLLHLLFFIPIILWSRPIRILNKYKKAELLFSNCANIIHWNNHFAIILLQKQVCLLNWQLKFTNLQLFLV